ncbi:related to DUF207 domain protein [Phialocephala subalpina]|uniref:tRNA(Phe) 7-[(3-amino-3-carboxypropyl)-4-demethylwyosine(37)-N(4)]-methyltransferase n=1 Tax=Phialocephala subalpina TaxID=576137 RepID=A0A1L7WFY8_9HELO|nr:related to DUF207 domain protein [Phialocephala subalpina]
MASSLPPSFIAKKRRILEQLSIPVAEYDDLSPKGSVDEGIRELIDEINAIEGCVTTSSCAGRVSVFLEGKRKTSAQSDEEEIEGELEGREKSAGVGGKGGGGRWLFVSHDPVKKDEGQNWIEVLGMKSGDVETLQNQMGDVMERRLIHFKFEPMILHVLTASLTHAQKVLSAALQAGFRESGALNLIPSGAEPATPMVGIRTMGLTLESVIGFERDGEEICIIPEWQLRNLVEVSNQRFVENTKRIERFRSLLKEMDGGVAKKQGENGDWEDAQARKERKRAEGLERARALKENQTSSQASEELLDIGILEQNL